MSIDISLFEQAKEKIEQSKSILITSHKSPDGDSVGCSVGLYQYLKKLNKTVQICHALFLPFVVFKCDVFNV